MARALTLHQKALNSRFAEFCRESARERAAVFEATADKHETVAQAIEKDFWVCRTIDALFHGGPRQPRLLFKGGTSLSKGYGLIRRFSEDIDIVISAPGLRFSGGDDPGKPGMTGSARKRVLSGSNEKGLPHKLRHFVNDRLAPALEKLLPDCEIAAAETRDRYGAALKVKYPTVLPTGFEIDKYLERAVLVECGGRSAREPVDARDIVPYIHAVPKMKEWDFTVADVTIIHPRRTFWDKAIMLHDNHRLLAADKLELSDENRLSRHYYDVAMMAETNVGKAAVADTDLLAVVRDWIVDSRNLSPKDLASAVPGSFKLVPPSEIKKALRRDYEQMRHMIFGKPNDFDWIVTTLAALEQRINAPAPKYPKQLALFG